MNFGYYPYPNGNSYQQLMQMQSQQNNSFVHVPSEEVAKSYAVAPGGSVTFIDDNAPYCYTKTVGFSQFDTPVFRKFRLVEETSNPQNSAQGNSNSQSQVSSEELESLRMRVEALENQFNNFSRPIDQSQQNERKMKNESFVKQRQSGQSENQSKNP